MSECTSERNEEKEGRLSKRRNDTNNNKQMKRKIKKKRGIWREKRKEGTEKRSTGVN